MANLITDLKAVPSYVLSSLDTAREVLTSILSNNLTIEELPMVSLAATKYYEAESTANVTLSLLAMVIYGYIYLPRATPSLTSNLARIDGLAQESIILALSAKAYASTPAPPLRALPNKYIHYAWHLYTYAIDLSRASKVASNITGLAGGYAWRAMYIFNNSKDLIEIAAALGYAIDSVALSSTYMAMHPGYPPLVNERFKSSGVLSVYPWTENWPQSLLFI